MAELPEPEDYESVEDWLADVMSTEDLDMETMDAIVEKFGRSPWVK